MSQQTPNISFDGRPIVIDAATRYLVLLDPLVLDGLAEALAALPDCQAVDPRNALAPLNDPTLYTMRIGVHSIPRFRPGRYQLSAIQFIRAGSRRDDPAVFDVDSGAVVVVDYSRLGVVARLLTWEQYDRVLRELGDASPVINAIAEQAGGLCFAIIGAMEDTVFSGDGSYKLRKDVPKPIDG